MKRRTRIILIGAAIAVVALALAAYLTLRPPAAAPAVNAPQQPTTPLTPSAGLPSATGTPAPAPAAPPPSASAPARASDTEILQHQLTVSAMQFAERFGTYSNQGDFQNLTDLEPLMTDRMRQNTERVIAAAAATSTPTAYVGVTTHAVNARIATLDDKGGRATVVVSAQRATQTGDAPPVTRYQDLTIEFRKTAGLWKVDSAVWPAQ